MEFHIRCNPEDISRYVFVPGSHTRATRIASYFEDAKLVSDSRGYLVYSGMYEGIFMTVSSTGMGGPSTAIALEELGHMGADTFIRVGSCGTMQDYVTVGDVIVSTGTYRAGGTANRYLPIEFPAVPDFEMTTALVQASKNLDLKVHVGLGSAGDAFYAPKGDPREREVLKNSGIVSGEMESDTLYIVATVRGFRAGALYACDGTAKEVKPDWGITDLYDSGEVKAIEIALEAMKLIAQADANKAK